MKAPPTIFGFDLINENNGWTLQSKAGLKLQIDFDENKKDYQRQKISKSDLLARAVGLKKKPLRVLDLTAGLGIDAVHLARLGCEVFSLERNPVLFFLLSEAQKKSVRPEIEKIRFHNEEAEVFLKREASKKVQDFDVVYYDPMYPEKRKSALSRKEMQIFRALVGEDHDADRILQLCLSLEVKRLVVKRPLRADAPTKEKSIQMISFSGTTVRYDVYLQGSSNE